VRNRAINFARVFITPIASTCIIILPRGYNHAIIRGNSVCGGMIYTYVYDNNVCVSIIIFTQYYSVGFASPPHWRTATRARLNHKRKTLKSFELARPYPYIQKVHIIKGRVIKSFVTLRVWRTRRLTIYYIMYKT